MLSTRLSQSVVFVRKQDLGHAPAPYPLKAFTVGARPPLAIPRFATPRIRPPWEVAGGAMSRPYALRRD